MNWLRTISNLEILFMTAFLLFYSVYGVRMYFISKKIKVSKSRLFLKFGLRTAYFSLFLVALLGPSFGDIKKEIKAIGKDIYIAIDLSNSMEANDISPSRIEKIKFELNSALKNFNSDRVGLIVFSNEAFVQCPLTYDHKALKLFLESLSPKLLSESGTDLNAPLALAYEKLTLSEAQSAESEYAKVFLLVTDGENFGEQQTYDLLKKYKKAGIHFFVLGIGSEEGGMIPLKKGYKKNSKGENVLTKLNSKALEEMCDIANGTYYEITPETNDMRVLVNKLLKVEGTLKGSKKIDSAANKYFYFLFIGLVLFILDVLISVKTIKI